MKYPIHTNTYFDIAFDVDIFSDVYGRTLNVLQTILN